MKYLLHFIKFYNISRDFSPVRIGIFIICLMLISQSMSAQIGNKNHYKTWVSAPQIYQNRVLVEDQFMSDSLTLVSLDFLSNPTLKDHEGQIYPIVEPDHHLNWYRVTGRDTLLNFSYKNQLESTAVAIDKVEYLLVPTQKQGHMPPVGLDHYKAYRIMNPTELIIPLVLQDQFDLRFGLPDAIASLTPAYFLTPAVKNGESDLYDSLTHYVAYQIPPRIIPPPPWEYLTTDQFGEHYLQIIQSIFLLVPTEKILPIPPQDTSKEHFQSWRVESQPFQAGVHVQDQFMTDNMALMSIEYLANPAQKVHNADTFKIKNPNNHLTWYRAEGRDTLLLINYVNQLESVNVVINKAEYLLVPTQKMPHAPPQNLDHYKAYRIFNPVPIQTTIFLRDQIDDLMGINQPIEFLVPVYFLTPAMKNFEQMYDTVTHYVAYDINPKKVFQYPYMTMDQFGDHSLTVLNNDLLMVPTKKLSVEPPPDSLLGSLCGIKCNDLNGNGFCDLGEPPLSNWTINLTKSGGGSTSVQTNLLGGYCFNNLYPGQYTISETLLPGWQQTGPQPPGTYTINLGVGQNITGLDFANIQIPHQDTLKNHYKVWRTEPSQYGQTVNVKDQFINEDVELISAEFLSNPSKKTHFQYIYDIVKPDYHLTWYKTAPIKSLNKISYINQFESKEILIDSLKYLLVPTQKLPHATPDSLNHYTAYRIANPHKIITPVILEDQFDQQLGIPEHIDSIKEAYFIVPASKNYEEIFDSVSYYVGYEIYPKRIFQFTVNTIDQFGPRELLIVNSELLLVPTAVVSISTPDTVSIGVNGGWNMISVPLIVNDYRKSVLYPSAISDAYAYEGTYVSKEVLENGIGYWLKFSGSSSSEFYGSAITTQIINVVAGWNLIGSISEEIATSSITSNPPGIITSDFFEYTGSYNKSTVIKPGVGYWVMVNQAGQLILSSTLKAATNRIIIVPTSERPPLPPDQNGAEIKTIPLEYSLGQNYPNPFNPTTLIEFELPEISVVNLTIYNTLGQVVAVLLDRLEMQQGPQKLSIDASNMTSGVYYYKLEAEGKSGKSFTSVKKMVILK